MSEHIFGNSFYLLGSLDDVNTTLESCLFEMTKTATTAQYLGFYNIARALKLVRYIKCFFWRASYIPKRNSDFV
jgi:hypothetical protein